MYGKDEIANTVVNVVALLILFDAFQVMHVLGFDPHAFAHFRDERKRRRGKVFAAFISIFTMEWYIIDL